MYCHNPHTKQLGENLENFIEASGSTELYFLSYVFVLSYISTELYIC